MPIFYPDILQEKTEPKTFSYVEKDAILYALGVGMGADPLDEKELDFLFEERKLKILPTAAAVLPTANGGFWPVDYGKTPTGYRQSTVTASQSLHGEQRVTLYKSLPPRGTFTITGRTTAAYDKGKDRGAAVYREQLWIDATGEQVAKLESSRFLRADGGFGGPSEGPRPHQLPDRAPDVTLDLVTRPDQCAIYRLSGDTNPLHIDPVAARSRGFDRPILHGLCTSGFSCRAVLQAMLDYDVDQVFSHELRFSSPVYPGDVLSFELWRDAKQISFQAHVRARGVTVVKHGLTVVR